MDRSGRRLLNIPRPHGSLAFALGLSMLLSCGRSNFYFFPPAPNPGPTPGLPDSGPQPQPDSGGGPGDSGASCSSTQMLCGGACIDPLTDPNNCGSCGNICSAPFATICSDGTCVPVCTCTGGLTNCGPCGTCVDTTSDADNCGACGRVCPQGQPCVQSACACPSLSCMGGCVDGNTDPHNCGVCSNQCQTGICDNGACQCNPDAGLFSCAPPTCSDTNTDVHNCGVCGNDCTQGGMVSFPDITCFLGQCECQGGQATLCPSAASFPTIDCIDTTSDPDNCGGCGLALDGGGPFPDGGLPPSRYVCGGVESACIGGTCECPNNDLFCGPGTWTADAGPNDGGACLNTTANTGNCGACGNVCGNSYAAGAICQFSSCLCMDAGICVATEDPLNPSCSCDGTFSPTPPNPSCAGPMLHFTTDVYPLLSATTVTNQPWGLLVGCATAACHDSSAAGGLAFTDPDASYQSLINVASQICPSTLIVPADGADSLLFGLLDNTFRCPNPIGGVANPMPIDDAGIYQPLSACLAVQVREWIDQGAVY